MASVTNPCWVAFHVLLTSITGGATKNHFKGREGIRKNFQKLEGKSMNSAEFEKI